MTRTKYGELFSPCSFKLPRVQLGLNDSCPRRKIALATIVIGSLICQHTCHPSAKLGLMIKFPKWNKLQARDRMTVTVKEKGQLFSSDASKKR